MLEEAGAEFSVRLMVNKGIPELMFLKPAPEKKYNIHSVRHHFTREPGMKSALLLLLCLPALALGQDNESPAPQIELQEWDVPWEHTRPRDPDPGPDGKIWFVGQQGDYVASLDPANGSFKRLPLESGAGPHNLIVAPDGTIWYAGNRATHIGRLDPQSGKIHQIAMPDERARDPHTLVFDGAGDIWFTVQAGNFVGKLDTESEEVSLIDVPTERARPYGIKVDGDTIWVALFGTNKLARVNAKTLALEEIALPREDARPRRIGLTSDGKVWYVDYAQGKLGRLDPADSSFREWDMPSGSGSRPYGMAVDDQDRIWFVETGVQPNRFVGFDPASERFLASEPIASGGGTVRHMVFDAERDAIWFGSDANTVGRASLPK